MDKKVQQDAGNTGKTKVQNIIFKDEEHERFYYDKLQKCKEKDSCDKAAIYTLGIDPLIRVHIGEIYKHWINETMIEFCEERWQTYDSRMVIRLAYNIYTGDAIPSYTDEGVYCDECQIDEYQLSTISKVFNCQYLIYFFQALALCYPQHMQWEVLNDFKLFSGDETML